MVKKPKKKNLKLYSNLVNNKQAKKDARLKRRAQRMASMPKNPWKRLLYRLNPKNFFMWLFSKDGLKAIGKTFGILFLVGVICAVGVFMYFRKDLSDLDPEDLSRRIYTTVNTYTDRNGVVLWEDKGDGDYKLTVTSDKISDYIKQATVAIEDRTFYEHKGISLAGIFRAIVNNARGGSTQGGSTLTQQLVKQVFFADEAEKRGLDGVPRKIKEVILSTEIERLYNKDQILTMYLNESPYGGRRNGVESAAQTYFGKSALDLTLAEAALLAAIPNNPAIFNPYNIEGNERLIARQHKVLGDMVEMNMITQQEADEAKQIAILDTIKPQASQLADIKAPHFVLEARQEVESQLGVKTVRAGGLTIRTTLDWEVQQEAEKVAETGRNVIGQIGADNFAITSIDVDTGQIIAMIGSSDFHKPGYGQRNAATSLLEPGSSIKPIVDYAPLFMQRSGVNYGPGSILKDENIDHIYCGGNTGGKCTVQNYTRQTYGDVTIRQSLASSLNRPAVKAMYIVGPERAIEVAREMGDKSYCQGSPAYLSSAIGGGCTVRQVEHTNAFATLARYGKYLPTTYILEVNRNTANEQLYAWRNEAPKQVLDPQVAYMVADILTDPEARRLVYGNGGYGIGFEVKDVWTANKTGTTDNGRGQAKDSWTVGFSTKIATGVWVGNHDGAPLRSSSNYPVLRLYNDMSYAANKVYEKQGKWKTGDQMAQPAGMKRMTVAGKTDIWPSWFDPKAGIKTETMVFDRVSKRKATDCTPLGAREELEVSKSEDPISKKEIISVPEGYNAEEEDNIHDCSDAKPSAIISSYTPDGRNKYKATVSPRAGTHALSTMSVKVGGKEIYNGPAVNKNLEITVTADNQNISVYLRDSAYYETTETRALPPLAATP